MLQPCESVRSSSLVAVNVTNTHAMKHNSNPTPHCYICYASDARHNYHRFSLGHFFISLLNLNI